MTDREPLRIGLLLDGPTVPLWQTELVDELVHAAYCSVELAVFWPPIRQTPSVRERLAELGPRGSSLARWYLDWEERWTRFKDDPLAPADISSLVRDVPQLQLPPGRARDVDPDNLEQLERAHLDVLIRLGSRMPSIAMRRAAGCGVWSLHHGGDRTCGGDDGGFWEVWNGETVTTTTLYQLSDAADDEAAVVSRTSLSTRLGSVAHNRRASRRMGARLIARQLQQLHARGAEAFYARVTKANVDPRFCTRRLDRLPPNARFPWSLCRHWWGKLSRRITFRATKRQWILLYALGTPIPGRVLHDFRPLRPPTGRFWADPFVMVENGSHHVFFEEFDYAADRGHIAVITIAPDGTPSKPQEVLVRPYHLSYPFLLRWRDALYMIPETGDRKTLEVYRCTRFPDEWEFHGYLMRGREIYDATLCEWGGRWWLFATLTRELCNVELHVFSAESPLSETWTPHPANPVVSDVSRARPAGPLFTRNGRLYRPSQDCSPFYGYAIRLHEVVTLTEQDYVEREAGSIMPEWAPGIVAVHQLSFAGDLTVVDAQVRRWRLPGR
jgi:hypothetical protein